MVVQKRCGSVLDYIFFSEIHTYFFQLATENHNLLKISNIDKSFSKQYWWWREDVDVRKADMIKV